MNKFIIASLLLINIALNGAVYLKKPVGSHQATFAQLREINDSDFGKRILDTIALQLANKSPLSDVASMLAEIRTNLILQQQESDSLHVAQEQECADTIAQLEATINTCQAAADDAAEQIGVLKSEIKAWGIKITQMNNQLDILSARQSQLALAREQDHAAFLQRQEQGPVVLGALDMIVEKLRTIVPTSVDGAFAELAKIGKSNPIAALL
jgi:peptidoglycan hydrolase CwlO-like protein